MKIKKLLFLSLIIINLNCCTVEKRLYTKGYNIQRKSTTHTNQYDKKESLPKTEIETEITTQHSTNINSQDIALNSDTFPEPSVPSKISEPKPCDKLILNNREESSVIIEEISETLVKYRKCENQSGPLYSISKNKVYRIEYSNGTIDDLSVNNETENSKIKDQVDNLSNPITKEVRTYKGGSVISLVLGILSSIFALIGAALIYPFFIATFVFSLIGFIIGVKSLKLNKERPSKHRAYAILGIIFCGVGILIGIAYLLINMLPQWIGN